MVNTGALENPNLIDKVASTYGSQCVVLSIDVRKGGDKHWEVWSDGGKK